MRLLLSAAVSIALSSTSVHATSFSGKVYDENNKPISGAFVSARDTTRGVTYTVTTNFDGCYETGPLPETRYELSAHMTGRLTAVALAHLGGDLKAINLVLLPMADATLSVPAFAFISTLPEGDEKRKFALDCMGCHALDHHIVYNEIRLRTEDEYKTSVMKMLVFAGANTPFPVMSPERNADSTAAFLSRYLTEENIARSVEASDHINAPPGGYTVTEWDLPTEKDFPHDLKLDGKGNVLVTGMVSGMIHVLDAESGKFTTTRIEAPGGNPRAIDVAPDGDWWILGGTNRKLSRFKAASQKWDHFDIAMYPHSTMLDDEGRVWFNGHFTIDPIQMGYVDGTTGEVTVIDVCRPTHRTTAPAAPFPTVCASAPTGPCGAPNSPAID